MIDLLFASLITFGLILILRTQAVYKYRMSLIDKIHESNMRDLNLKNSKTRKKHNWRYNELDKVTENKMIFQFWRPFDSFYPDQSFLDPEKEE